MVLWDNGGPCFAEDEVTAPGFRTATLPIEPTVSVTLAIAPQVDSVAVAGSAVDVSASQQGSSVDIIPREEIRARIDISNAAPKRTFLGLVAREDLDPDFRREIENFRIQGSSIKINLALDGLPNFKAYPNTASGSAPNTPHKTTMHVCP